MAIELFDICKTYGSLVVFDRFCCRIEEGAATSLMGPSGCGKTTLLRILLGLELPDSGQVSGVSGRRMSVVFQEDRLCDNLSAAANIRLVCREPLKPDSIFEAMCAIGLEADCARQPVRSLSGGQRRRITLLRALMADYDVLFMDEPFKGLDSATKAKTISFAKERSRGKTVVLITHDKAESEAMGDRMITLPMATSSISERVFEVTRV